MSSARQFGGGVLIAFVSIILIGFSLTTAITQNDSVFLAPDTPSPTTERLTPTKTGGSETDSQDPEIEITETQLSEEPGCPPPEGWSPYIVTNEDSLETIAIEINSSVAEIEDGNCRSLSEFVPGTQIYLPANISAGSPTTTNTPQPTATPSPTNTPQPTATDAPVSTSVYVCGPPSTWVTYTVQSGDTLYSLGNKYNVSVLELQTANCLGASTYIQAGEVIYVPFVITNTPSPTSTLLPTETQQPSATHTSTATFTPTPTITSTSTPTPTATQTETPTPTNTALPPTATFTPEPTATETPLPPAAVPDGY